MKKQTWNGKSCLEEEGVKVIDVIPNMKVHSKLCLIKKNERHPFNLLWVCQHG